jgi:hypothetical protein
LVVGRYQPWLTAADAYVARYPTKLAFCSRFRRQREMPHRAATVLFDLSLLRLIRA